MDSVSVPRKRRVLYSNRDKFWSKVIKTETCWLWHKSNKNGEYGWLMAVSPVSGNMIYGAHRMAWELCHGPIPDGLWVLHHCDNPPCVRPDHLFLGTNKDNIEDRIKKRRALGIFPQRPNRVRGKPVEKEIEWRLSDLVLAYQRMTAKM